MSTLKIVVKTPRGEFELTNLTLNQAIEQGFSVHHRYKKFAIMVKNNNAIAIVDEIK